MERRDGPTALSAAEAGEILGLPADVVRALADAGYLHTSGQRSGTPRFALGDLKAFQARAGAGPAVMTPAWSIAASGGELDPAELLSVLEGRAAEIAQRTLDLLIAVFPEAAEFTSVQRERFIEEARERIQSIIALCARGPQGDEPLEIDLADIGADAAQAGVPLPGLLMTLRVTRDLVVQTAVEAAEARGGNWGLALAITLTRVLPSIDRLSDAVARGYWEALLEIEAEVVERYRNVVEQASDGVFELDDDGVVRYANPAARSLLGELEGRPMAVVLPALVAGAESSELAVDGVPIRIRQFEQSRDGVAAGWVGVISRLAS